MSSYRGHQHGGHQNGGHDHGGHDHGELGPPVVTEVAENVFAYIQPDGTWWINNTGFLAGADGVIAVDTCATERRTKLFLDHVRQVTDQPLRMLVNTHHHGDHTHGNYLTYPATIVGHENCRELILQSGLSHYPGIFEGPDHPVEWGDLHLAPPTLTFSDSVTVHAGDIRAELHYIGNPAHTTNDIVAWLPDHKVLYTGDLVFNQGTPFVLMGSVSGSLRAIQRVRQFAPEVIVPGHGPVCDIDVLDQIARYYQFVADTAIAAQAAGIGALEAARSIDLGEFAELSDPERIVGNLHRALYELGGGPEGGVIDVAAAIGDMITFNGGRPLRCLA
jgi:cyclase